jgi:DTW domain-containing protein YfiP
MRAVCPRCDFIIERCLCDSLTSINNQTTLIILQHPNETKHALNTVRLMKTAFKKIHVFMGENFDDHNELKKIIAENNVALIFPNEKSTPLIKTATPPSHLILLDGTWKKAKKIFFSSTILHSLTAFSLTPSKKSEYKIRSSQFEESLSTLEASTLALNILEPTLNCESIENAFKKMIDFQIEKMGAETFEKNYRSRISDED